MSVLSYSYSIKKDSKMNGSGHGNNVVDGLNTTTKCYFKGEMEPIGKLASNDSSKIGMIPSE